MYLCLHIYNVTYILYTYIYIYIYIYIKILEYSKYIHMTNIQICIYMPSLHNFTNK